MSPAMRARAWIIAASIVSAAATEASACSLARILPGVYPANAMDIWVTALPDTVYAGPWSQVRLGRSVGTAPRPGSADLAVFGQLVGVEQIRRDSGGVVRSAAARAGNRILLVPRSYGSDCAPLPWSGPARWIPSGSEALLVSTPRAVVDWVDGIPTFDVLPMREPYPHASVFALDSWKVAPRGTPTGSIAEFAGGYNRSQWQTVADYWMLRSFFVPTSASAADKAEAARRLGEWARANPGPAGRFPASLVLSALGIASP